MTVPYAKILMSVNGGAFVAGARIVPTGATLAFKGESTAGWDNGAKWEIFGIPPNNDTTDWAGPGDPDWTYDSVERVWRSTSITPASFTLPPDSTIWGKWLLRLVVNRGIDPTTRQGPQTDPAGNLLPNQVIDISGGWEVISPYAGLTDVSPQEGEQFDPLSYIRELQYTLRTIDIAIGSSGGTVPMGGDVIGPSSNTTVVGLRDVALDASMATATDGDFIRKVSGSWKNITTAAAAIALIGASVAAGPSASGKILESSSSTTAAWVDPSFAPSTITPGTAGQVFFSNGTPAAAWTSLLTVDPTTGVVTANRQSGAGVLGGLDVQYTSTTVAKLGTYSSDTAEGALWLGAAATSATVYNWAIEGNASRLLFNTPSGGTMEFRAGAVNNYATFNDASQTIVLGGPSYVTQVTIQGGSTSIVTVTPTYVQNLGNSAIYMDSPIQYLRTAGGVQLGVWTLVSGSQFNFTVSDNVPWSNNYQAAQSDHVTLDYLFTTQAPYAGAATNLVAGDFVINTPASVGAGAKRGGLVVEYDGTVCARLGGFSNGTYGALWCMDGGTPTSTNYTFLGRTNETYFGVPTAGTMYFGFANTHFPMILTQSSVMIGDFGAPIVAFDAMTTSAVMHFTEQATSASIIYDAVTSDVAARDLVVTGQGPWASATTHKSPGNIVFKTPLSVAGDSFSGGLVWKRGDGSVGWRLGYYGGPDLTYTGMWFEDGGSPSSTGYAFLGTATRTDLNATTNLNLCIASAYQIVITGTTSMTARTNANVSGVFTLGTNASAAVLDLHSSAGSSTLYLDAGNDFVQINTSEFRFKNGNSPLIDQEVATGSNPGSDFTLIAQGGATGQNGGRLLLQGGLPGSGGGAVSGNVEINSGSVLCASHESTNGTIAITRDSGITIAHQVTKSGNYTFDSSGAGDEELWITAAATYTLPDPTNYVGRRIRIFVNYDPTASGGTIARHAGEKINGATANLTLSGTHKFSCLVVGTNGTDWVIGLAAKA